MTYAIFMLGFAAGTIFRSCLRVERHPYFKVWFGFRNTGLVWQGHSNSLWLQYVDRSSYTMDVLGVAEKRRRNLVTGVQLLGPHMKRARMVGTAVPGPGKNTTQP